VLAGAAPADAELVEAPVDAAPIDGVPLAARPPAAAAAALTAADPGAALADGASPGVAVIPLLTALLVRPCALGGESGDV
jgi:hypothetical protein